MRTRVSSTRPIRTPTHPRRRPPAPHVPSTHVPSTLNELADESLGHHDFPQPPRHVCRPYRPARPLRGATAVRCAHCSAQPQFGASAFRGARRVSETALQESSAFRSYFSKPGLRITSKLVEIPQNPPSSRLYRFPETTNNLEVGEHRSRSSASPAPSQRRPYPGPCRGSRKRFPTAPLPRSRETPQVRR